ncbi:MAG: hypothetical protein IIC13_06420 [SAR324 cluster bacterium]|nr:hypothetical protein [SAR324 cluster bacterium]
MGAGNTFGCGVFAQREDLCNSRHHFRGRPSPPKGAGRHGISTHGISTHGISTHGITAHGVTTHSRPYLGGQTPNSR